MTRAIVASCLLNMPTTASGLSKARVFQGQAVFQPRFTGGSLETVIAGVGPAENAPSQSFRRRLSVCRVERQHTHSPATGVEITGESKEGDERSEGGARRGGFGMTRSR